jgi:hypothetical protein
MDAILELWSVMAECFSGSDRLTAQSPEAEYFVASTRIEDDGLAASITFHLHLRSNILI